MVGRPWCGAELLRRAEGAGDGRATDSEARGYFAGNNAFGKGSNPRLRLRVKVKVGLGASSLRSPEGGGSAGGRAPSAAERMELPCSRGTTALANGRRR